MAKRFNVTGACDPNRHYMVNLDSRLKAIREMVDSGDYFTINRARQYGKTTTLQALARYLKGEYEVVLLDFQRLSESSFQNEQTFSHAFVKEIVRRTSSFPDGVKEDFNRLGEKSRIVHFKICLELLNSGARVQTKVLSC